MGEEDNKIYEQLGYIRGVVESLNRSMTGLKEAVNRQNQETSNLKDELVKSRMENQEIKSRMKTVELRMGAIVTAVVIVLQQVMGVAIDAIRPFFQK